MFRTNKLRTRTSLDNQLVCSEIFSIPNTKEVYNLHLLFFEYNKLACNVVEDYDKYIYCNFHNQIVEAQLFDKYESCTDIENT